MHCMKVMSHTVSLLSDLEPSDAACGGFLSNSQQGFLQQHQFGEWSYGFCDGCPRWVCLKSSFHSLLWIKIVRCSSKWIWLVYCEGPPCPCSHDLNAKYVGEPLDTGSLSSPPEKYPNPSATGSLWPCEFCGPLLHISTRSMEEILWLSRDAGSELPQAEPGLLQSVFPDFSQGKTQSYCLWKWQLCHARSCEVKTPLRSMCCCVSEEQRYSSAHWW